MKYIPSANPNSPGNRRGSCYKIENPLWPDYTISVAVLGTAGPRAKITCGSFLENPFIETKHPFNSALRGGAVPPAPLRLPLRKMHV